MPLVSRHSPAPPALAGLVPASAYDADKACVRPTVRLDASTRLVRDMMQRVHLHYRRPATDNTYGEGRPAEWVNLITWDRDGAIHIYPDNVTRYQFAPLRRIAVALPDDWSIEFRGRRLRPRLVFRGVHLMMLMNMTFRADGAIQYGRSRYNATSLAELHEAANETEGVRPIVPRRGHAPTSVYAVRAMVSGPRTTDAAVSYSGAIESWLSQFPRERATPTLDLPDLPSSYYMDRLCSVCGARFGAHFGNDRNGHDCPLDYGTPQYRRNMNAETRTYFVELESSGSPSPAVETPVPDLGFHSDDGTDLYAPHPYAPCPDPLCAEGATHCSTCGRPGRFAHPTPTEE